MKSGSKSVYPPTLSCDFSLVKMDTLKRYADHFKLPVDSSNNNTNAAHYANSVARHFESMRDINEDDVVRAFSSRLLDASSSKKYKSGDRNRKTNTGMDVYEDEEEYEEDADAKYCICRSISYGEMIGCDNENCKLEWFHMTCLKMTKKPIGKWYCPNCGGPPIPGLVSDFKRARNMVMMS